MAQVHAVSGLALIVVTATFTVAAALAGVTSGSRPWLERLRLLVTVLLAAEVVLGLVTYAGGERPAESLHLLYGLAAVSLLPFAGFFAAEAPPKPRSGVLAAGGVLTLGVLFRSMATGG